MRFWFDGDRVVEVAVVRTRALLSLFVNSEEYMQSGVVHAES
jgi:hypothetical protein